jgi:predicted DNA-binding transcriptional regulator AlpA
VPEKSHPSADRRKRPATPPRPPRPGADLLEPSEAAHLLGLSVATLARWRMAGKGPAFVRPAPRLVRYRRADIDAWLGAAVRSTTEADARGAA